MADVKYSPSARPVQVRGLSTHMWVHLIERQRKLADISEDMLAALFERTKTNDGRTSYEEAAEIAEALERALFELFLTARKVPR